MSAETHQDYLDRQLKEYKDYLDEKLAASRDTRTKNFHTFYSAELKSLEKTVEGYKQRAVDAYKSEMADIERGRVKADEHGLTILSLREKSAKRNFERNLDFAKQLASNFADSCRGLL